MNTSSIITVRSMPAAQSKLVAQTKTTVKMSEVMPCNHYYNVVVVNEKGPFQGEVVTHLSLEDWCLLHGYSVLLPGTHRYIDSDGQVKTRLFDLVAEAWAELKK